MHAPNEQYQKFLDESPFRVGDIIEGTDNKFSHKGQHRVLRVYIHPYAHQSVALGLTPVHMDFVTLKKDGTDSKNKRTSYADTKLFKLVSRPGGEDVPLTNENMATVLGWQLVDGEWLDKDGYNTTFTNNPDRDDCFRPIADLNHTALVEARLSELDLTQGYIEHLLNLLSIDADAYYLASTAVIYHLVTAAAQTRCDAAWVAYSAWKEQTK